MTTDTNLTEKVDRLLIQWNAGDESALDELFGIADERLKQLAKGFFHGDRLHRLLETGDVSQEASIRLFKAMKEIEVISSTHFFRLAAMQIRRELADLGRKYYSKNGLGAKHFTRGKPTNDDTGYDPTKDEKNIKWNQNERQLSGADSWDPKEIVMMCDLVDKLPEKEAEVFDLIEVWKLTQEKVAARLEISTKTVSRQLESAKALLGELLLGKDS